MSASPRKLFDQAREHFALGRLREAESVLERVIQAEPANDAALHLYGLVALHLGQSDDAVAALSRAVGVNRNVADYHCDLGVALTGVGRHEEAIGAYRKAIQLSAYHGPAHANMAAALAESGRLEEAGQMYERAIGLAPSAAAYSNYAMLLQRQGKLDQAIEACLKAVKIDPRSARSYNNLGYLLNDRQEYGKAAEAFRQAVMLRPAYPEARYGLAIALDKLGERAAAIGEMEAALKLRDNPAGRWELAALKGEAAPGGAPAEYVRNLYDAAAHAFDQRLVGRLKYRGPDLLWDAVMAARPGAANLDVMDLGCGTGLCGPRFRAVARTMVGVDLSSRMIELAKERKAYDVLRVGEILEELALFESRFDLLIAADVLIYFGDLRPVFGAGARALRAGGLLAFTVEAHEGEGFLLRAETRRYAHSLGHLRSAAEEAGLEEASIAPGVVRTESDKDVAGWVVVLEKPGQS